MANKASTAIKLFKKLTPLDKGLGPRLPEAYKKFYNEWKLTEKSAVHYIPETRKWHRDEETGEVTRIADCPIRVRFPAESHEHIWGGEGVVQGFQKRSKYNRPVPHFWIPHLRRSVVFSEVLNKYMSVVVTPRTIDLIHEHYGFDHYILKTLACDLQSLLALGLKRKILQDLSNGCPAYSDNPQKQKDVYESYKNYLSAYTEAEIEWYGYSFEEACKKYEDIIKSQEKIVPLKHIFRQKLIEDLEADKKSKNLEVKTATSSWMDKIMHPFGNKPETS